MDEMERTIQTTGYHLEVANERGHLTDEVMDRLMIDLMLAWDYWQVSKEKNHEDN